MSTEINRDVSREWTAEFEAIRPNRLRIRRRARPGAPPGVLLPDPGAAMPDMRVFAYGADRIVEKPLRQLEELDELVGHYPVVWLDMDGLGDVDLLRHIGERFGLHALALEDVINVHQRAKVEVYGEQIFAVIRAVCEDASRINEQVSFFLGKNFLVTFQEFPGDAFDPVRQRLRDGSGRIRARGPDYLLYSLLDAIVDRYFPALEEYGESLEETEATLFSGRRRGLAGRIHAIKWDLLSLRHAVWPLREALRSLMHDATGLIQEDTRLYLRDTADHVGQLIDLLESYREISGGLLETHLALMGNRMNEIMKVLTMTATIFIPLSFLASLYGMNFDTNSSPINMPELHWHYGYVAVLAVMTAVALGMLYFFWRRGWLHHDE